MNQIKTIAEIGINHNGDVEIAKRLIDVAAVANCDYVKFQKRNPDLCVPESQKNKNKVTPWGDMTYLQYKHKIEFGKKEYHEIDNYCRQRNIKWFASVWDIESSNFMKNYSNYSKIPSALITNLELCQHARENYDTLIISTGMSIEKEIEECIEACDPNIILHTNSTYPSPVNELNLKYIQWLTSKYPDKTIGYSGHEFGLVPTFIAVVLGAQYIERHVTLDRTMWGSDQMSSVEPAGLIKMTKAIKDIRSSIGELGPRTLLKSEKDKREARRK